MKNDIELLAPAGSYEALIAAVQNGANAIYLGGSEFSARAFATNFNREEIINGVKYAHLRGVKIYVTVNVLYSDSQFDELTEYITFLYTNQVDALIIQDIGLLKLVRDMFPDFEVHMSTQASIYNLEGVKFFEKLGVKRVVLSRENTLFEIKEVCSNSELDVEVFVHGAICISYSGQCLMSSYIGKRSGNKGMCAQPCRLAYKLKKDDTIVSRKETYLLSPKDLCTIDSIHELIDCGVKSFKIEGRMKRPEYVATIVKEYRRAIDGYFTKQKFNQILAIKDMKAMFNRGFTGGYLLNDLDFMADKYPGNRGVEIGKVISYNASKKRVAIKLCDQLMQNDRINFKNDLTRTITKLYLNNRLVNHGDKGDIIEIELDQRVASDEIVYKVSDIALINSAKNSYQKENIKIPVKIECIGRSGKPLKLIINDGENIVSGETNLNIELANNIPLSKDRIKEQLSKLGNTVYVAEELNIDFDEQGIISIKELNQLRRALIENLNDIRENKIINKAENIFNISTTTVLNNRKVKNIGVKVLTLEQLKKVFEYDLKYYYFPICKDLTKAIILAKKLNKVVIPFTGFYSLKQDFIDFKNSPQYQDINSILVGDYGSLNFFKEDKNCIIDTSFNIYNSHALDFFSNQSIILSLEITKKQINQLKLSNNELIVTVYGKVENMVSKHCPISQHYNNKKIIGCNLCKKNKFSLIDRKNEQFDILMDDNCIMHLLNNHCLYFTKINSLKVDTILLSFTNEDSNQIDGVITDYLNILDGKDNIQNKTKTSFTNGYFNY